MHFSGVKTCSDPIWPMYFLSAYFGTDRETNLLSKHLYFQSSTDCIEMIDFIREIFFRIPSCLEQLLPSYKYFLVTMHFLISYFLKINAFPSQLLFWRIFFSRISNYSEHALFQSSAYSEQLHFQKRNLFRGRHFLKKVTFSDSSM